MFRLEFDFRTKCGMFKGIRPSLQPSRYHLEKRSKLRHLYKLDKRWGMQSHPKCMYVLERFLELLEELLGEVAY